MARELHEMHAEAPTALWLTPSDTIRSQTLSALQTPGHPYREALETTCGQRFQVCDLENAAAISPHDWERHAITVVATIQSFRIEETGMRMVYAFSETLEPHFKGQPPQALAILRDLPDALVTERDLADANSPIKGYAGQPKFSLANWLALQNPFIIVDEAHNSKTERSFEVLKRLNPAAILELTATPIPKKTNVLYHVSAQELQAEHMVKLPIVLMEHPQGPEAAIFDALDVASMIAPQVPLPGMDDAPLFARPIVSLPELAIDLPAKAEIPNSEQVRVEATDKGKRAIVTGPVSESLAERLTAAQRGAAAKEKVQLAIERHNAVVAAQLAPVSRGAVFAPVPRLCYSAQGELQLVEREAVLDAADVDLLADPVSLPGFQIVEQANAFEVYLDGTKVKVRQADAAQLQLDTFNTTLTEDDLTRWLDREVRQSDIVQSHLRAYLKQGRTLA